MTGTVFDIKEFAMRDGPGGRTTVFMKGCPLRCRWCHNPEGLSPEPELYWKKARCSDCGRCRLPCSHAECQPFGRCLHVCPNGNLSVVGQTWTVEKLTERLTRERDIYGEEGGVTFSGGEPLAQSGFLIECLKLLDGRINRAIQTSGFATAEIFDSVLKNVDYILYDLKLMDDGLHKKYTGQSNAYILRNFESAAASKIPLCVRIPLIPTVNDTETNIRATAEFLNKNNILKYY